MAGCDPAAIRWSRHVTVPEGADAADDWIVEHAGEGDIVVTADIPLASRALKKGARVLGPTGKPFTEGGIGMALGMRDLQRHVREATGRQTYNADLRPRTARAFSVRWKTRSSTSAAPIRTDARRCNVRRPRSAA